MVVFHLLRHRTDGVRSLRRNNNGEKNRDYSPVGGGFIGPSFGTYTQSSEQQMSHILESKHGAGTVLCVTKQKPSKESVSKDT